MLRSIFIFLYRYDVVRNIKSFLGKTFFYLHTRGAWRNQTKIAGKMDGSDSSKPRGIAGEKCAIRMPSFHCYSRWRTTPETQFNQVRCNIGAALKIAT